MNALNNPHPGEVIRDEILTPLGLSLPEAAVMFGMRPEALMEVMEGQTGITSELAYGLERAGFSTARFWIALQDEYDRLRGSVRG